MHRRSLVNSIDPAGMSYDSGISELLSASRFDDSCRKPRLVPEGCSLKADLSQTENESHPELVPAIPQGWNRDSLIGRFSEAISWPFAS